MKYCCSTPGSILNVEPACLLAEKSCWLLHAVPVAETSSSRKKLQQSVSFLYYMYFFLCVLYWDIPPYPDPTTPAVVGPTNVLSCWCLSYPGSSRELRKTRPSGLRTLLILKYTSRNTVRRLSEFANLSCWLLKNFHKRSTCTA